MYADYYTAEKFFIKGAAKYTGWQTIEGKVYFYNGEGVAVTGVQPKSPAASLRLQEGDVITAVNGTKVKSLSEFYAALDLTKTKSIQFTITSGAGSITTGTYNF